MAITAAQLAASMPLDKALKFAETNIVASRNEHEVSKLKLENAFRDMIPKREKMLESDQAYANGLATQPLDSDAFAKLRDDDLVTLTLALDATNHAHRAHTEFMVTLEQLRLWNTIGAKLKEKATPPRRVELTTVETTTTTTTSVTPPPSLADSTKAQESQDSAYESLDACELRLLSKIMSILHDDIFEVEGESDSEDDTMEPTDSDEEPMN